MNTFKVGDRVMCYNVQRTPFETQVFYVDTSGSAPLYVINRTDGKGWGKTSKFVSSLLPDCVDGYWVSGRHLKPIKEDPIMKYEIGDHVELCGKDEFVTSTSVQVGDKGQIKDKKEGYMYSGWGQRNWEYLVCFNTHNGPRNQWVYAYHIKPISTDAIEEQLLSQIKGLEDELHEKRTMLEEYRKIKTHVKGRK